LLVGSGECAARRGAGGFRGGECGGFDSTGDVGGGGLGCLPFV
jgi:hypothetical protein